MNPPDRTIPHAPSARRLRFAVGVTLIAVSFTVYLAYFFIVLYMPVSNEKKVAAIVVASLLSWTGFGLGIFLAGHEGYHFLKHLWLRRHHKDDYKAGNN